MKPKLSPLVLLDFAIVNCKFSFTSPSEEGNNIDLYSKYSIDIDFAVIQKDDIQKNNNTRVFIKVSINEGDNILPGYSIFAEGVAIFNLIEWDKMSEKDKNGLLQYSSVSIALNSLRGFISTLTASAPLGRYILPSFDVNDLFIQKANSQSTEIKTN